MSISDTDNPISAGKEAEALSFILRHCFKSGFGILSKSELDLILFTALIKFSDQAQASDYALSKYLQITQRRITNLKEKASVKYLVIERPEAIEKFIAKSEDAKIDGLYIDIPITDVAVRNELESILDEYNILLHSQLNPKIFRIRLDGFLELSIILELEQNPGRTREEIEGRMLEFIRNKAEKDAAFKEKLAPGENTVAGITKKTVKEAMVKGGLSFGIDILASLVPGGAIASPLIKKLLENIGDKV